MIIKGLSAIRNIKGLCRIVKYKEQNTNEQFPVYRVYLINGNNKLLKYTSELSQNDVNSSHLKKKSVRIDEKMCRALYEKTGNDKTFLTKIINSAVMTEISTRQIDLIRAKKFEAKVTVYFSSEEYKQIEQVIKELKDKGFKKITFSSLVRSILYKRLGLVQEIKDATPDPDQTKEVA